MLKGDSGVTPGEYKETEHPNEVDAILILLPDHKEFPKAILLLKNYKSAQKRHL